MKCNYCNSDKVVKKGKRGIKTRYFCNSCSKSFQDKYTYSLYNRKDDWWIKSLNANSVGTLLELDMLRKNSIGDTHPQVITKTWKAYWKLKKLVNY